MINIKSSYILIAFVTILLSINNKVCFALNLDPPQITCISVLETGEIKINWNSLDNSVLEFRIYYSSDNISWIQAGSVESQNFELDYIISEPDVNANLQSYYLYITAVYPSDEFDSDVFNTMFLVADNSTQGVATLIWNDMGSPKPAGSSDSYSIYYSVFKNGISQPWNLITSDATNILYNYTIPNGFCYDSINFKIEVVNSFGCLSSSNISGNWFIEDIYPEKPVFDSVSVFDNKYVILGWEPSISEDAMGTIIYRYESGIYVNIDTVFDNLVSVYIDSSYQVCGTNVHYAIASIDSCGKPSPGSYQTPLRVILLNPIDYNLCSSTNTLNWEAYINADPMLEKYEIWASINNAQEVLIDEVGPQTTVYEHENVLFSTDYSYRVKAVFGDYTSTSCVIDVRTSSYKLPEYIYLANTTVLVDNTVELTLDLDIYPVSCEWLIYRSELDGSNPNLIKTINRNEVSDPVYIFNDTSADASKGSYEYFVEVMDSCNLPQLSSNLQKSIFLEGTKQTDTQNQLTWSEFSVYEGGVQNYYIHRFFMSDYPGTIIDSADSQTYTYTDDISAIDNSITSVSYYVTAVEGSGNTFGYKEYSNSNIVTLLQESEVYFPNAFRPDGNNRTFGPVSTGFTGTNYLFQVFNRWGQLIYETNDPSEGWDGTLNGTNSPQGTYVYKLTYRSVFDKPIVKEGIVTLIN